MINEIKAENNMFDYSKTEVYFGPLTITFKNA